MATRFHQIELVLDWVRQRFLSASFAESSHRPQPRRKPCSTSALAVAGTKTTPTLALLQTLGISARPVLVSQMFRGAIADVVPTRLYSIT